MNTKVQERIASVKKKATAEAEKWVKENEKDIADRVRRMLDSKLEEVVVKLLGFKTDWDGQWEVDNCNGRSGESAAGDWLRESAQGAVKKWLTEQAGNLPTLSKAVVNNLRQEYLTYTEECLERALQQEARDRAKELATKILHETLQP